MIAAASDPACVDIVGVGAKQGSRSLRGGSTTTPSCRVFDSLTERIPLAENAARVQLNLKRFAVPDEIHISLHAGGHRTVLTSTGY